MEEITLIEAGRRYGLHAPSLRGAVWRGALVARKLGRDWVVKVADLELAIEAGRVRLDRTRGQPSKKKKV